MYMVVFQHTETYSLKIKELDNARCHLHGLNISFSCIGQS